MEETYNSNTAAPTQPAAQAQNGEPRGSQFTLGQTELRGAQESANQLWEFDKSIRAWAAESAHSHAVVQ